MQFNRYRLQAVRLPLLPIFLTGLVTGIVIMIFGKSILLENTGILDEYTLYHMKYMTVDSGALFYYVLRLRLGSIIILAILATTYLGLLVCAGAVFWYGLCGGAFLSVAVIRYGVKGTLLAVTGIFPQYLLYVPAMIALLFWAQTIYRGIYLKSEVSLPKCLIRFALILLAMTAGCFMESFANPALLSGLLKFF